MGRAAIVMDDYDDRAYLGRFRLVAHPCQWRWSNYTDIRRNGCSPEIAAVTGGTTEFLEYVDSAVRRIHAVRADDARSCWQVVGETVGGAEEGRG